MKASEAIRAIKEKLTTAYAGRINTKSVISALGPVVYAQLDNDGRLPIRVCIQEGPHISDRFTMNLADMPEWDYLLAGLFREIVPQRPVKARVLNY